MPSCAASKVGYVFQQYNLIPHLNVAANIDLPQRLVGTGRRAMKAAYGRAPERARPRRQGRRPCRARCPVASSSVSPSAERSPTGPRCCSPTSRPAPSIPAASQGVIHLLSEQHAAGQTIVMVTHDLGVAAVADRTIHLLDGRVVHEEALVP